MKVYNYKELSDQETENLTERNAVDDASLNDTINEIIEQVRINGDKALLDYAERFDKVRLENLFIGKQELETLAETIGEREKKAIKVAYDNIYKFHEAQLKNEEKIETTPGVICWREPRAIEKVGLYVPGGTAVLPSTFLMLCIPARIAGCREIVVCSPPQKDGKINGYIAYCAILLGIDKVYLSGGAQAVAAMAYGTETIPKVYKIFGPGNRFVTNAKSILQAKGTVAIDMPAGPSEVLVVADETAKPVFLASDLLAQAEHGPDSQVVLVATNRSIVDQTLEEVEKQLRQLSRADMAAKALEISYAIVVDSIDEAMAFSNQYAPEHLIIAMDEPGEVVPKIMNAGSVFLGHYTPESAGDYASGTNHTLPTSAFARNYSGVSVDSFIKKITFQEISQEGIENLGPDVEVLAALEGLEAHRNAVSYRLGKDQSGL